MNISIRPGSSEVIKEARELFGIERVKTSNEFRAPVILTSLNKEETKMAKEYFEEMGKKVEEREMI